jgi:hypothetical protein
MSFVKRHGGFTIEKNEDGYFWRNGAAEGYFETERECAESIDRFNRECRESDPNWPPPDSPSLDEPWFVNR